MQSYLDFCERLCLFDLEKSRIFPLLIGPDHLYKLLLDSCDNSVCFMLLLLSLTYGTKDRIYWYIEYAERIKVDKNFKAKSFNETNIDKVASQAHFINEILSTSNTSNEFVNNIKNANLYNNVFDEKYAIVFRHVNELKQLASYKKDM